MDAREVEVATKPTPAWWTSPYLHVIAAALLLTALNALKPVHMDDQYFLMYGSEFAAHPTNPYAFELQFGTPVMGAANDVLVPPVLPYWLGLGQTLVGDQPVALKCWLFPFALALAWSIDFLAARLAPSLRTPLMWLTVMSPTVLPGFNFMLEVPVLAVGLTALAVAIRSLEKDSIGLTVLAGLLGGLAVETKYTGSVACAVMVAWCLLNGRLNRGAIIALAAVAVFVGWEYYLHCVQGQSHFVGQIAQRHGGMLRRCRHLIMPLLTQMAGLAPVVALLGLTALGWSRRAVVCTGLGMLGLLATLMLVPERIVSPDGGKPLLSYALYTLLAIPVWIAFVGTCRRLSQRPERDRFDLLLLLWIVFELGGYFVLSPFPAARRLLGPVLVFTLLVGRLAYHRGVPAQFVSRFAVCGAALASLFFFTDLLEARAIRQAAHSVARGSYDRPEGSTFWHFGWWGFSYYIDRTGLRPLQLNRETPREGDLLALHDTHDMHKSMKRHSHLRLELIDTVVVGDDFPLRTMLGYYMGRRPLESHEGQRVQVFVYRIAGTTDAATTAAQNQSTPHHVATAPPKEAAVR